MCFYKEAHKIFKYRPGIFIFIDAASAAMAVLECDQKLQKHSREQRGLKCQNHLQAGEAGQAGRLSLAPYCTEEAERQPSLRLKVTDSCLRAWS